MRISQFFQVFMYEFIWFRQDSAGIESGLTVNASNLASIRKIIFRPRAVSDWNETITGSQLPIMNDLSNNQRVNPHNILISLCIYDPGLNYPGLTQPDWLVQTTRNIWISLHNNIMNARQIIRAVYFASHDAPTRHRGSGRARLWKSIIYPHGASNLFVLPRRAVRKLRVPL